MFSCANLLCLAAANLLLINNTVDSFSPLTHLQPSLAGAISSSSSSSNKHHCTPLHATRRDVIQSTLAAVFLPAPVVAAEFTPGGTLVDRSLGIQVNNPEASPSRKADNSNVLFDKDYYFKFGVAAPWIEPGSTDFPKTVPFTPSQQRYDTLKKYADRVKAGVAVMVSLRDRIDKNDYKSVADASSPEYMLRPMGLMANGLLASENTGSTNELFLSRWYVNEVYLRVNDIRNAASQESAREAYDALIKSVNSFYSMLNRVITAKVGDKFDYLAVPS
jgi:hypothetical protein